jgi:hypothetical protein
MKRINIKNADALETEIYKKKLRLLEIEKTLGRNVDYMRENFSSMALQSLVGPGKSIPTGVAGNLMLQALNNEELQNSLAELVERLAEKAGNWIQKMTLKFLHK